MVVIKVRARQLGFAATLVVVACGGKGSEDESSAPPPTSASAVGTGVGSETDASAGTDPSATSAAASSSSDTSGAATSVAPTSEGTGGSTTDPTSSTGEVEGGFVIDLPLVDERRTRALVESLGGSVQGGSFGPDGWTTQTRDDIIVIPLPPGTLADVGTLEFSVTNFEWDLTTMFWEAWVLVSLDSEGPPFTPTDAGTQAGLQSLYLGFNPDDPGRGYRPVAYFNLRDRACPGWEECTGERRTPPSWLSASGTVYQLRHVWAGAVDDVTFSGNGVVDETIDLRRTSPMGSIRADQLYLTINACGGSTANTCGPWDGPPEVKGGPIGVTYSALRLDLTP